MSMATPLQRRRFLNSVNYLRDEVEPLIGQNFAYAPGQIQAFLNQNTGPIILQNDLLGRPGTPPVTVPQLVAGYEESINRDNTLRRRIGRWFAYDFAYGNPRLVIGSVAAVGGVIGLAITGTIDYQVQTPITCSFGSCYPNELLGATIKFVNHAKDVGAGVGLGALGAYINRRILRNRFAL